MSITIRDLLHLPSLSSARVVAGHSGLDKIVATISVLEYAEPTAFQDELFQNNEFYGSEIVITGLITIKDDVGAQCRCIRRLHEAGEVGLILYYVGIFLPCISPELISLADELGFTLICMPENRMDLRYSEVIYEVTEAIVKDRMGDAYLVGEMLERIAFLPDIQRNMDSVLRMLSDRLTSSLFLTDAQFHAVNIETWPRNGNIGFEEIAEYFERQTERLPAGPQMITVHRRDFCIFHSCLKDMNQSKLHLILLKEKAALPEALCRQALEVVRLFISIWSQGHGNVGREELVRAILKDEPVKMRRLAEILHVDVEAIHHMILIRLPEGEDGEPQKPVRYLLEQCARFLKESYETSLSAVYEHNLVLFTGNERIRGGWMNILRLLLEELKEQVPQAALAAIRGLENTAEVRKAFLDCIEYMDTARMIFPGREIITLQEIRFARRCREILDTGEAAVEQQLAIFRGLDRQKDKELYQTLEVYLLDADQSVTVTAELLYVHKNTIKYRIGRLSEILQCRVSELPGAFDLYQAAAVKRLLEGNVSLSERTKTER